MGSLGGWEILIILGVLVVLFGAKRLPEMGRSLGKGMREFKDSVTGVEEAVSTDSSTKAPATPGELPSPAPASEPAPLQDETEAEETERETVR